MPAFIRKRPLSRPRCASAHTTEPLEPRRLLAGTVTGVVFHDRDNDSVRDPADADVIPAARVYADVNLNGAFDPAEPSALSGADGTYTLSLNPGTYYLRVSPPAAYRPTAEPPGEDHRVVITDGALITGEDLHAAMTGAAEVFLFNDLDGDGARDPGEPPLVGRGVYTDFFPFGVHNFNETVYLSDADGRVLFYGSYPGNFPIRQLLPPGWVQTSPANDATLTATILSDAITTAGAFGSRPTRGGYLSGVVFQDNGDGVRQAGEGAWANRVIYLDANNNSVRDAGERSATTNSNGEYVFNDVAPGAYVLRQVLAIGGAQTVGDHPVTVQDGTVLTGLDFGTTSLLSISGTVFNDTNANGRHDAAEAVLANRTIYVDLNNNGFRDAGDASAQSDAQGRYTLPGIKAGTYTVRQLFPQGFVQTLPAGTEPSGRNVGRVVNLDGDVSGIDFGSTASTNVGRIAGFVFDDTNGDGVRTFPEPNLVPGRVVYIDANFNGRLDPTERSFTTNVDGYWFDALAPGTYRVSAVVPGGYTQSFPAGGASHSITVSAGQVPRGDFGLVPGTGPAAIHGDIFIDVDRDGIRDPSEVLVALRTVWLDADNDAVLDAGEQRTVTDNAGTYHFDAVAPGTYTVRQVLDPDWVQTAPAGGGAVPAGHPVTVNAGQVVLNLRFGTDLQFPGSISGTTYHDADGDLTRDPAEAPHPGVTVWLDTDNDYVLDPGERSVVTGSDGRYAFFDVPPGTYPLHALSAEGWIWTRPWGATTQPPVGLAQRQALTGVDFGFLDQFDYGLVYGEVFEDNDSDGVRDHDDAVIPPPTVFIDDDNDGVLDPGERTAAIERGSWWFDFVPTGVHTFRVVPPSGFVQTYPPTSGLAIEVVPRAYYPSAGFGLARAAAPTLLVAVADAYVRDGGSAGNNYGTAADLQVKKTTSAGLQREALLRFNLGGISGVGRAILRLSGALASTSGESISIGAYPSSNVAWSETAVTWNTRPAAAATPVASQTASTAVTQWYEWDVTDYLRQQKAAGATAVTFVMKAAATSAEYVRFSSDEAANSLVRPQIVVEPPVTDRVAPKVAAVTIGGDGWAQSFASSFATQGLGAGGFALPAGGGDTPRTLPWANADRIAVRFSEHVIVQQDDLRVTGAAGATLAFRDFDYDPATFTATWRLARPFGADRIRMDLEGDPPDGVTDAAGNRLRGAANGTAPGDAVWTFRTLPGDATGDGRADARDLALVKRWLTTTATGARFNVFADIDANGQVNAQDLARVRAALATALPGLPAGAVAVRQTSVRGELLVSNESLLA